MLSSSNTSKIKKACSKKAGKSPSFVCEFPLQMDLAAEKTVSAMFEASRQLYNACLGEGKKRLVLLRESKEYQTARSLKKGDQNRQRLFDEAREHYQFSEYAMHAYAGKIKNSWIGEHIGINLAQKLATRAYKAVEKLLYRKAKQVRFKSKNQLDSIEEKTNKTGIRWKENGVQIQKHLVPALIDLQDPVMAYALTQRVKYCRLVKRRIKGKILYFVQLICEGNPLSLRERKTLKSKTGIVQLPESKGGTGIDLGPSTIAIVGENSASLHQFCDELKDQQKELRKLQRKVDRQRRANNPENYDKDGKIKPGPKKWVSSTRQKQTQRQLAESHRISAAHRKSLHGKLINETIPLEDKSQLEKVSCRSFQKNFGKSVGKRAPGMFIERLKRKAENAGGSVVEFSPFETCLSQICLCGKKVKKPLSQRIHRCSCGVEAQRDLFSAYLARFVQDGLLNVAEAQESWQGAEMLLRTAFEQKCQTANSRNYPASFGVLRTFAEKISEKSGSSVEERTKPRLRKLNDETWNVVGPDTASELRV